MEPKPSVLSCLSAISEKRETHQEINLIVEKTYNFASIYLKYQIKNLEKVLQAEQITHKEWAIDAISYLFERDESGVFIRLVKAFSQWEPKIDTEERALFFLERLASKSVEKYVSEFLRSSDPFFSTILDSVNYLIVKEGYKKKRILDTTYIVKKNIVPNLGTLPDSKNMQDLPIEVFSDKNKMLSKIFNLITSDLNKTPAIPLNALILKIKKIRVDEFRSNTSTIGESGTEINSMLKSALENTIVKLENYYQQKEKISNNEVTGIKAALESIAYDLKDGGVNTGLHKYFLAEFPEKTFSDYQKKYQNIFEYLYKVLKKEIGKQINN